LIDSGIGIVQLLLNWLFLKLIKKNNIAWLLFNRKTCALVNLENKYHAKIWTIFFL